MKLTCYLILCDSLKTSIWLLYASISVSTTNVLDVLCRFWIMSDRKNEYDLWRDLIFNYNIPSKLPFCIHTCPNNCGVVVAGHNGCCVLYCFRCCDYQNTVLTARGMLLCQICHIHVNTVLLSFSIYMLVLVKFLFWVISDCIILFTNKNIFRIYITKMRLVWCRWNQKPFKRINVQEKLDDLGRLCFLYLYTNLHQECALLLIFPLSRIINTCLFNNAFHMFNIYSVYYIYRRYFHINLIF